MSLFAELKRRNVLRVITAYVVTAWLIIQVVETIFPAFGFGDAAVRIAVILMALGLVPTAIISWAFELTPEGIKREQNVDHSLVAPAKAAKRLDRIILVILAFALAFFIFDKLVLEPVRDAELVEATTLALTEHVTESWRVELPELSLAVMPFVNLSGDDDQEYFSAGLSEDIATALAKFQNLRVISPQITYSLRGAPDLDTVGRQLKASYVIGGSVRAGSGKVRINARLLEVSSGIQLWANSYDEELSVANLFRVQDDVAARVVATIADSTGVLSMVRQEQIRSQPTKSLEAYDCVLRSHEYRRVHDTKAHLAARECLELAVQLDPDYADAWAHLAFLYREEFHHERNLRPDPLARAFEAARRAIELDPSNHMGRVSMAFVQKSLGDWHSATSQAQKALELNPYDATTLGLFSTMYVYHGEIDTGLELADRARTLVPDPPGWIHIPYASAYYQQGDYEKVLETLSDWVGGENVPQWHLHNTVALAQLGRQKEAAEALEAFEKVDPALADDPILKINKYASTPEVAELYLNGLVKAGLQLEP